MSHQIVDGSITPWGSSVEGQSSRMPAHSRPVDIKKSQNAQAEEAGYPGSVEDEFFYSPRSSPTPSDGTESAAQELPKTPATPKEHFSTPRADTPEYLKTKVNTCTFIATSNLSVPLFSKKNKFTIIISNVCNLMRIKELFTHRRPLDIQS